MNDEVGEAIVAAINNLAADVQELNNTIFSIGEGLGCYLPESGTPIEYGVLVEIAKGLADLGAAIRETRTTSEVQHD